MSHEYFLIKFKEKNADVIIFQVAERQKHPSFSLLCIPWYNAVYRAFIFLGIFIKISDFPKQGTHFKVFSAKLTYSRIIFIACQMKIVRE